MIVRKILGVWLQASSRTNLKSRGSMWHEGCVIISCVFFLTTETSISENEEDHRTHEWPRPREGRKKKLIYKPEKHVLLCRDDCMHWMLIAFFHLQKFREHVYVLISIKHFIKTCIECIKSVLKEYGVIYCNCFKPVRCLLWVKGKSSNQHFRIFYLTLTRQKGFMSSSSPGR